MFFNENEQYKKVRKKMRIKLKKKKLKQLNKFFGT